MEKSIRRAALAGSFYPQERHELKNLVDALLGETSQMEATSDAPKILIVPHAGYAYSGTVAAAAYSLLKNSKIKKVLLIGPSHFQSFNGLAVPSHSHFETPIGLIPVDQTTVAQLGARLIIHDKAHEKEHSLETQLPFLQRVLKNTYADPDKTSAENSFSIIPIVVGNAHFAQISDVIELLWGTSETLIVISSDLSHNHAYTEGQKIDANTEAIIHNKQYDSLSPKMACGYRGISGALYTAKKLGIPCFTIQYGNSSDKSGDKKSVVGYGSFGIGRANDGNFPYSLECRQFLIDAARQSIINGLHHTHFVDEIDRSSYNLLIERAVFVTLKKRVKNENILRGCIGSLKARRDIVSDVIANSYSAAFQDSRFPPLSLDELNDITIEISVLSPQTAINFSTQDELLKQLRPELDGLVLTDGEKSATFLPSVWKELPDPKVFLSHLKCKAGFSADYWSNRVRCSKYSTVIWGSSLIQ